MADKLKILGLSATVIKGGNCDTMVQHALDNAVEFGNQIGTEVEPEFLTTSDKKIELCKHCQWCIENRKPCAKIKDDAIAVIKRIIACDGLLLGSPTWTLTLSPVYGILTSRARYYAFFGQELRNKIVGFMTVGFLGYGLDEALDQMYHLTGGGMLMIPVGRARVYSSTVAVGQRPKYLPHGVLDDKAGMTQVKYVAERVVEVARMMKFANESGMGLPDDMKGTFTGAHMTKKRELVDGVWQPVHE